MLTEYASTKNKILGVLAALGTSILGFAIFLAGPFYAGWFVGIVMWIGGIIAVLGPFITYDNVVSKLETGEWD